MSTKGQEWYSKPRQESDLYLYNSATYNEAILTICFVINSVDSGRRYHMQVFKIKEAILSKGMSHNDRSGTRTHANEVTGARKPAPLTMVHPACMFRGE